jgi:hypothetical protein
MTMRRISMGFAISMLLAGCHGNPFRAVGENCHKPQVYQRAGSAAPLKVPEGVDAPNVAGALVIPSIDAAPPPPGPSDPCLDEPPRYKPAPPVRPSSVAPAQAAPPNGTATPVKPPPVLTPDDAAAVPATPSDSPPPKRVPADAAPANGPVPPVIPPPQPAPVDAAPGSAPIT